MCRPVPGFALALLLAACSSSADRSGPQVVVGVAGIAAGGLGTCAVGNSGGLVCWGAVPDGTPFDTTLAVNVALGAVTVTIPAPLNAISLSKTLFSSTGCVVAETGQTYCWGHLDVNSDTPLPFGAGLAALAGATSVSSVAMDAGHLCVTRTDNFVRCFGEFDGGARGTDSVDLTTHPAPDLVANSVSPTLAAFGTAQGQQFGCALRTDSLVACWGARSRGELAGAQGDTVTDCGVWAFPNCQPAPALIAGGTKYRQISAGGSHACAVRVTGEVDCWGMKPGVTDCATVGNCVNTPTEVALPGAAVRVVAGIDHACALLSTGAAYCWGSNAVGQLGRTGGSSDTPVAVSGGYVFVNISAGANHTCGVELGSGAVGCWGANDSGQLGDGTLINKDRPVAVIARQ
jgi:hypothetical protein